jgi:hypothetical protein
MSQLVDKVNNGQETCLDPRGNRQKCSGNNFDILEQQQYNKGMK